MRKADHGPNFWRTRGIKGYLGFVVNILCILIGVFFLFGGTYASVQSIIDGYKSAGFGGPFSCDGNGL